MYIAKADGAGGYRLFEPAMHELVRARSRDRAISEVWEGAAELSLFEAPGEEHTLLSPVEVARGYRFTFAYTVDDLETVREYAAAEVQP